jgi:G3E family GTPase
MNKQLPQENTWFRLPIYVITGFLGSGKTTLLNQLLNQPGMQQTMVIVNEWGEVGIDHFLVETNTEDIILLEGGCLCCYVRTDLIKTLEKLFIQRQSKEIPEFVRILVETTGLADPAPILRTLIHDQFIATHYRLEAVLTTVDAKYGSQQLTDYDEAVKQAALANHLILTKIDQVDTTTRAMLQQRLHRLNPTAIIHEINLCQEQFDVKILLNTSCYNNQTQQLDIKQWLQADVYLAKQQVTHEFSPTQIPSTTTATTYGHQHDIYIKTFCIEYHEPLSWLTLERWIQQLTRLRGKDLLRTKGIVYTLESDLPIIIQGVQHLFQPPMTLKAWPTEQRCSQIVFITRNIDKNIIEQLLHALIKSDTVIEACSAALILLNPPTGFYR